MQSRFMQRATLLPALLAAVLAPSVLATDPPSPELRAAYQADGTLKARAERARERGNHVMAPERLQQAHHRLKVEQMRLAGRSDAEIQAMMAPPPAWRGLPTTGTPKVLVLCLDFPDYPTQVPADTIKAKIFGDGVPAEYPYESLRNYYQRASYKKLDIQGNVLGWYRYPTPRASLTIPTDGNGERNLRESIIKQALKHFKDQGHDFSQYDNNGDGVIDYFVVLWTGPNNGWSEFWWAYKTTWGDSSYTIDGKQLRSYVWQYLDQGQSMNGGNPTRFTANTIIHETGHALGLPDYYDYDDAVGPKGGVGGLDMMASNKGDHNAFSKWVLDWMTPRIVTTDTAGLTLKPKGEHPEAVLMMNQAPTSAFGEYFIVENRQRVGNDNATNWPGTGLLIWHVDATLNGSGSNFVYDNSYTEHKLLRLMEADGLEHIEQGGTADAKDFWSQGQAFTPFTKPSSNGYKLPTNLALKNISAATPAISFDIGKAPTDPTPPTGSLADLQMTLAPGLLQGTLTWGPGTAADPESGIVATEVQWATTPDFAAATSQVVNGARSLDLANLDDDRTYYARVRPVNGGGLSGAWTSTLTFRVSLPALASEALECPALTFKQYGTYPWFPVTLPNGRPAIQSGAIPDTKTSYVMTYVDGPAILAWNWRVSSQPTNAFLYASLNGTIVQQISGDKPWARTTLELPAGRNLVRWGYRKSGATAVGQDAGWLGSVTLRTRDLKAHGKVDTLDLTQILRTWTGKDVKTPTSAPEDMDGDGDVDDDDLALFLASW